MQEVLQTGMGLLGGLAIFLFGMNYMSGSLQAAAGDRMRAILGAVTKNPLVGVLAGALATAVLQSSSATTVMTIGFVSAGLMGLRQAIPIIMGANIGTTITAQLIAFKLSDYVLAIVFAGFVIMSLAKNEQRKLGGRALFGFGLLFLGIGTMGDAMKPLAEDPLFATMISQVTGVPVLGVLVGTLMTVIVQSSSATIAVLQNLASVPGPDGASIIGLEGAIPFLLGDNLGTTITALLASIGQSRDAKRVALSHCLFNLSGLPAVRVVHRPLRQRGGCAVACGSRGAGDRTADRQRAHLLQRVHDRAVAALRPAHGEARGGAASRRTAPSPPVGPSPPGSRGIARNARRHGGLRPRRCCRSRQRDSLKRWIPGCLCGEMFADRAVSPDGAVA